MNHRGIEYTVTMTMVPGVWKWQFRIGDEVKTGKTETRIEMLAIRRASAFDIVLLSTISFGEPLPTDRGVVSQVLLRGLVARTAPRCSAPSYKGGPSAQGSFTPSPE